MEVAVFEVMTKLQFGHELGIGVNSSGGLLAKRDRWPVNSVLMGKGLLSRPRSPRYEKAHEGYIHWV